MTSASAPLMMRRLLMSTFSVVFVIGIKLIFCPYFRITGTPHSPDPKSCIALVHFLPRLLLRRLLFVRQRSARLTTATRASPAAVAALFPIVASRRGMLPLSRLLSCAGAWNRILLCPPLIFPPALRQARGDNMSSSAPSPMRTYRDR